jgi:hypothetical protein
MRTARLADELEEGPAPVATEEETKLLKKVLDSAPRNHQRSLKNTLEQLQPGQQYFAQEVDPLQILHDALIEYGTSSRSYQILLVKLKESGFPFREDPEKLVAFVVDGIWRSLPPALAPNPDTVITALKRGSL